MALGVVGGNIVQKKRPGRPKKDVLENPGAEIGFGENEDSGYTTFTDNGCWVHPKCLECPLPKCIMDMTKSEREIVRMGAKRETIAQEYNDGARLADLAHKYNLSTRTIQRYIKGVSNARP